MGQRSEEWNKRIAIWIEELNAHLYEELGTVELEGFVTKDRLTYDEAMKQSFVPMPPGTQWGGKWEYGWFRTSIVLPEEAQGQVIYFFPKPGDESLSWVNGKIACAVDLQHQEIKLTDTATAGEKYTIVLESYAGHGPRLENGGPYPPERVAVPEPPRYQVTVGESSFGIWNKDAFDLLMDAFTLYNLWKALDPKSLRYAKIKEGLVEFTKIVDYELPRKERNATFVKARQVLQPLLSCVNGSTAPEFTIFGQSHLDLAWKWPWEETRRKCGRTYSNQLTLADEYPDYKFLACEPVILKCIKEEYPELYVRIKDKVHNGQFIPEGGVWVEPDTNIPSGESLIRQFVWAKRWFNKEFNCDTKMVWLPDCFGFTGQLPQIMIGTGMRYFTTQKIARALKGHDEFPYNIFWWEGIDGTKILTHFFKKNNSRYEPQLLLERWNTDRVQQEDIDTFLFPFGYGDGGGGPTREMLEIVERTKDLEGMPRTVMQSPIAFFEDLEKRTNIRNRYVGEIYLAWHRGAYTAQAKTKKGNRKSEVAIRELELWGSLAHIHNKEAIYPYEELHIMWEKLLFNQFHDILAGTSITRVHDEAERDFDSIISKSNELVSSALEAIAEHYSGEKPTNSVTVYNSLSWERVTLVKLPYGMNSALDSGNKPMQTQKLGSDYYVMAKLPACGFTTIYPFNKGAMDEQAVVDQSMNKVIVTDNIMENEFLRIEFNSLGEITSIYDKEAGIEYAQGLCNHFRMYQDVNVDYDAWELSNFYDELPIELNNHSEIEVISQGQLFGTIRVTRILNNSKMVQEITIYADSRRVDFKTSIDWQESHKLLKVDFPVNVFADEALEEIQFGYVKRPTHRSRQYDKDRFEVCNHRYTALTEHTRCFAVLNDCKYGVSTNGNSIELSLLKAPLIPDMYADKGLQEFTYSIYAAPCSFYDSDIIRQGYELNMPATSIERISTESINNTLDIKSRKTSTCIDENSFIEISNSGIILETVKLADDGSGDIILRLYEAKGAHTNCQLALNFHLNNIMEVNMLEELDSGAELIIEEVERRRIVELTFRPFEIKTLRIIRK
ncbi:MAG: alpha-mannosidase [Clostridiales bacterium]|nr:alpha-mannosidase [Clostridiales bacterium]